MEMNVNQVVLLDFEETADSLDLEACVLTRLSGGGSDRGWWSDGISWSRKGSMGVTCGATHSRAPLETIPGWISLLRAISRNAWRSV